ncbi:MAG: flagellar hook-associated protein FlgK [Planctomycetes bacterium]|nr:flagellar hook-associated protein FlgK [Planctomycetota bacterium]MCB9905074.1 flagellar hook-associated protein FlgK [Planctomycetota bacterium]
MASIGLNIGLQALLTSQSALDIVGHNVANANTPGYSRQNLGISANGALNLRGLSIGSGVHADIVNRTVDNLLQTRLVSQSSALARLDSQLDVMGSIEALLGEPGGLGLSAGLDSFFSSISEFSSSPSELVLRTGMVQSAGSLASQFNQLATGLSTLQSDTANQVKYNIGQANLIAQDLVDLNGQISEIEAAGMPANDLRDQRQQALQQLAQHVDIGYTEGSNGIVRVTVGGRMLVGETRAYELKSKVDQTGGVTLNIEGSTIPLNVARGAVSGLESLSQGYIPGLQQNLDHFARNFILEMNRVHSTGVPASGGFTQLTAEHAVLDQDLDGELRDELLSRAGLPFDVTTGSLYVNITNDNTGATNTQRVDIDSSSTTVGQFIDRLNEIPGMNASLNGSGKLQLNSNAGVKFDFGTRLDSTPDEYGSFGGGAASLGSQGAGPFALSNGDTFDFTGPLGAFSVSVSTADFAEISQATAAELASVLNADANFQANGMRAVDVGGRLVVQTTNSGATASFDLTGGSGIAALGWTAGTTVTGQTTSVAPTISGSYSGANSDQYSFVPLGDGTIGTTPGLEVGVYDQNGLLVTTLSVGEGYAPGTELEVADGISVSFDFGSLSATHGDVFAVDLLADSDTTDVLVAFGLNGLFTGTDAATMAVRADLENDPNLLAASGSGASGDNQVLLDMLRMQTEGLEGLDGSSFNEFYNDFVGDVGFKVSSTSNAREVEGYLMENLELRREQVSGVNVDEELVKMIEFEQNFQAASRYIQVVNDIHNDLLQII